VQHTRDPASLAAYETALAAFRVARRVKEAERAPQEVLLAGGLADDAVTDDLAPPQGPSQFDTIATQLRPSPTEDSLRSRRVCSH